MNKLEKYWVTTMSRGETLSAFAILLAYYFAIPSRHVLEKLRRSREDDKTAPLFHFFVIALPKIQTRIDPGMDGMPKIALS